MPIRSKHFTKCGIFATEYDFAGKNQEITKEELSGFSMSEIDLLTAKSNWKWCDVFDDGCAFMGEEFDKE